MKRWAAFLPLLPVLLGLAVGTMMELGWLKDPLFIGRVQVSTGFLVGSLGILIGALAFVIRQQRIHRRRALESALAAERQAQAEDHRRFLRRLDHELKNPLTAIQAGLTNLAGAYEAGKEAPPSLANLRRQVDRVAALARDLRKLADLETCEVERAPVDLGEIIAEAVELARSLPGYQERAVRVSLQQVPWPLSPVQGDRDLLLLALYNLVGNALKFAGPGATVEVRAGEDGAWASIEVADNGPGIAVEDLPHLGEELYRGRGARGVEGAGLGLALVRRVVARLGGEMAIRSREGQGTVVALRLPLGQR